MIILIVLLVFFEAATKKKRKMKEKIIRNVIIISGVIWSNNLYKRGENPQILQAIKTAENGTKIKYILL